MPWGDGTGPMGMGPMTGRAAGFCAGYGVPGYANPIPRGAAYGAPAAGPVAPAVWGSYAGVAPVGHCGPGFAWRPFGYGRGSGRGRGGRVGW